MSLQKIEALAKYLEADENDIETAKYSDDTFEYGRQEWLVLTEEEAEEKTKEYIKDTAWAFRPEFLSSHMTGIDPEDLAPIQEKCESANPIILKLIDDFDDFVRDAVQSDGMGHFLASYDGEEVELDKGFLAYRIN